MKKYLIILVVVAVLFGLYKITSKPPQGNQQVSSENADLIMYWGEGCPHCEKVKDYIKANNSDQKMKIVQKEVFYNKANQKELAAAVKKNCPNVDGGNGIGVPIGMDPKTNQCILGDEPIINFIAEKTGQNK